MALFRRFGSVGHGLSVTHTSLVEDGIAYHIGIVVIVQRVSTHHRYIAVEHLARESNPSAERITLARQIGRGNDFLREPTLHGHGITIYYISNGVLGRHELGRQRVRLGNGKHVGILRQSVRPTIEAVERIGHGRQRDQTSRLVRTAAGDVTARQGVGHGDGEVFIHLDERKAIGRAQLHLHRVVQLLRHHLLAQGHHVGTIGYFVVHHLAPEGEELTVATAEGLSFGSRNRHGQVGTVDQFSRYRSTGRPTDELHIITVIVAFKGEVVWQVDVARHRLDRPRGPHRHGLFLHLSPLQLHRRGFQVGLAFLGRHHEEVFPTVGSAIEFHRFLGHAKHGARRNTGEHLFTQGRRREAITGHHRQAAASGEGLPIDLGQTGGQDHLAQGGMILIGIAVDLRIASRIAQVEHGAIGHLPGGVNIGSGHVAIHCEAFHQSVVAASAHQVEGRVEQLSRGKIVNDQLTRSGVPIVCAVFIGTGRIVLEDGRQRVVGRSHVIGVRRRRREHDALALPAQETITRGYFGINRHITVFDHLGRIPHIEPGGSSRNGLQGQGVSGRRNDRRIRIGGTGGIVNEHGR